MHWVIMPRVCLHLGGACLCRRATDTLCRKEGTEMDNSKKQEILGTARTVLCQLGTVWDTQRMKSI